VLSTWVTFRQLPAGVGDGVRGRGRVAHKHSEAAQSAVLSNSQLTVKVS